MKKENKETIIREKSYQNCIILGGENSKKVEWQRDIGLRNFP